MSAPCSLCDGFGFIVGEAMGARECSCRREALVTQAIASIPRRYANYSRTTWPASWPLPRSLDAWVPRPGCEPWPIVLLGRKGTGKTHLATALFREAVVRSPHGGAWLDWPDALGQSRLHYSVKGEGSPPVETLMRSPRLILLDDVGAGRDTPHSRDFLDGILRHRHLEQLPTIITSNANDLAELERAIDARLISRLAQDARLSTFTFDGPDHRIVG